MRVKTCALAAIALTMSAPTRAQIVEQFYAPKTVSIVVPFTAGGVNDLAARLVARHLGAFMPGHPSFIVQNQPSAGGLALANQFANATERDGSVLSIMGRALPQFQIMGDPNAKFDPATFTWLGSLSSYKNDAYLLVLNAAASPKTVEDLRKPGAATPLGANRIGSTNVTFATLARDLLRLNVQVVQGFPGAADITLAMQRREVEGQTIDLSAILSGQRSLWATGALKAVVQFGRTSRLPSLPDTPTGRELLADPKDRALLEFAELPFFMALPFAAPPGVPAARAAALQGAFMRMASDPAFLQDAKTLGIDISPIDGAAVGKLIAEAAATPNDVLARFKTLVGE